jgi:RNA 2',3'-cyclic 3'-phosphodiesterase
MSRLFIAIDLPEQVKERLSRLRVDIPGARWVPDDQLHLTLAFLGDQDPETIPRLKAELSAIRHPGFRLRFSTPGCFPNPAHPKVLWIGIEPEAQLNHLASQVRRALLSCDIPLEERPFFPHITLARLKLPAGREASAFLHPSNPRKIPPVDVRGYTLYESRLTSGGASHTPLAVFPLSTGQPEKLLDPFGIKI